MLVEFGRAGLIAKARQQPDKVRMALDKVRTDGLLPTIEAVRHKLDQPLPLGYCNVGIVVGLGEGVTGFSIGDRVASNGHHAEFVSVPVNLCAKVPGLVDDESAAFTVLGAIALQGIRLAAPTLGETVVVMGLGLIGLVTVQLLRAQGCRVLGLDFDGGRLAMAKRLGAEVLDLAGGSSVVAAAHDFSRGRGVDAVIITASTKSSEPVHQAAQMCRKRGRIVLVGVTGLELSRADFYEKELTFQVSCSYGPGRYDPSYEELGIDYPVGYVRWTEQRNFEAVLDMMCDGRLDPRPLVTHRFGIEDAKHAYDVVAGSEPSLGIVLRFADSQASAHAEPPLPRDSSVTLAPASPAGARAGGGVPAIGVIGAGNYAGAVLIPAFKSAGARLAGIASAGGASCIHLARKFGFEEATTDVARLLGDTTTDALVVCTRHDSHAEYVVRCLRAGKHVFVEKPLALTLEQLERVAHAAEGAPERILMVGFNRRFAPQATRLKSLLGQVPGPKAFVMTVNAGAVPSDHWTLDRRVGGGRFVGEGCHFVDLLRFLAGSRIVAVKTVKMSALTADTVTVSLGFADGSAGTVHYFANGHKAFPKERLEVFAGGRVLQLDNFRRLTGFGWPGFRSFNLWRQDKGQKACAARFLEAVQSGGPSPIPLAELLEVGRVCIEIEESLR